MNLSQQQRECSADIPVCRCADFSVGKILVARQTLESYPRFAGWKTCATADKNVCATLPEAAGRSADIPVCRSADFSVGEVSVARQTLELFPRFAGWKTCATADKNVCATLSKASSIHALIGNGLSVALTWARDRKLTLWGRTPSCRFEGAPPPRYIILSAREVSDPLRSQRHRNRQAGGLPHRVASLSRVTLALLMLFSLSGWMAWAEEPERQLRNVRLNVMYSSTLFSSVNRNDALAAIKVWIETIGRNRGFLLETRTMLFDSLAEAEKEIHENSADLVILDTVQYLKSAQAWNLDPQFIPGDQDAKTPDDYVVVVRRDRNLKSLADLRGKSVIFYKLGPNWGRLWMDVTLGEEGLGSVGNFFGSNSESSKPASLILPVFFGKTDAAVVRHWSLNTMSELNPQLAIQLQILTNSPVLPEAIACVHKDFNVFKEDLLQGMAELHTEPKGQQILLLFKAKKMERFKPECLDSARELLARQAKLMAMPARDESVKASEGKPKP